MCAFFHLQNKEAENWKGGYFDKFIKRRKILNLFFWTGGENVSILNVSNKAQNSDFGSTQLPRKGFFSFSLSKADKINKTDDISFKFKNWNNKSSI